MKKRNVFVKTAVATALLALAVSAMAGSLTVTKRTVANEAFGSAFTATTPVYVPNIAYVFNTPAGIVVNSGGTVNVVFTMTGGSWSSSAALGAANVVSSSMGGAFTIVAPVVSTVTTTGDTLTVALWNNSGSNITIGIGGTVTLTSIAAGVRYQAKGVTQGTPVNVSATVMNGVNTLESAAATAVIGYANAITPTFTASTETKKINLTVAPAATTLTTGVAVANKVQLGKISFATASTPPVDLDVSAGLLEAPIVRGVPAFGTGYTVTVAKSTGAFTAKQGVALSLTADCNGSMTSGSQTMAPVATAVTAATTTATITVAAAVAADAATDLNGIYVCSDYTLSAPGVISVFTPTVTASYAAASPSYTGSALTAQTGYALNNNGKTIYVHNLVRTSASYVGYVRIYNTGSIAAAVTAAWVNPDTGVVAATSAPIPFNTTANPVNFPSGAVATYSYDQIAAIIGAAPVSANGTQPRLQLTAPTDAMEAQTFLLTVANGNFSDISNAQQGN